MVAELEAEAAAALAAKEAELAEAQRGLDAAVASRFAQLEKQLDAKVGGGGGWRRLRRCRRVLRGAMALKLRLQHRPPTCSELASLLHSHAHRCGRLTPPRWPSSRG